MRFPIFVAALVFVLCYVSTVSAQQYIGDVIPNSLPYVPGSEITYFRIKDTLNKNKNLTLINYYSHQLNGQRIVESQIQRAVVIVHGLNRDPGTYESNMMSALAQVNSDPNVNRSSVVIMAPYFPNGDDKNYGYPWTDGLSPGRGSTTNCLVWKSSQWSAGGNNQYPYTTTNTSSYTVLDQIIQYFDNAALFPNMKQIVIAGHSLGAQTVQRYAAIGQPGNTRSAVSYWVANPNSYVWFSTTRPLATSSCPTYDDYREGYSNFAQYPMTYGLALVNSGRSNILANYNSKAINYGRGTQDLGDDSSSCAPETTGANRNERFFNFISAFPPTCSDPKSRNCDTVDFVNVGHDGGQMMASPAGQARLFLDNFSGNGSRSYDFGYPRQQAGDDPYPNPALNATAAASNNNTYAGNITYWGCWSDQNPRSLNNLTYTSDSNTIEQCTTTCAQGGNTIAGLEFGTQCFCGRALGYKATQVVDSSCSMACHGNSSETCGGPNRLSLFSNGRPAIQSAPGTPETVGDFYYVSCYTEASSGRALSGKSTSSSSMTLEFCANYCTGFQYFGTEYSSECYCGNSLGAGANRTSDGDCNMLCANDTTEFCGAGNRLTVYQDPDWTPGSIQTTATSPGSSPTPTGVSCPASNDTMVTSNGKNFTVECGIDHQGGDLTTTSVNNLQGCIDSCAQNSQCVDVSLSGNACYLKSSLGPAVSNANIGGAKLVTSAAATSTGTSTSTSSTSTSTSTGNTVLPTPSPNAIACPGSNNTVYTAANSKGFLIECGVDRAGGDLINTYVANFTECIQACSTTSRCLDVSFLGTTCYLKSVLQPPVQNPDVWGAKLVSSAVTTTTSSTSFTSTQTPTSIQTSPTSVQMSPTSVPTSPTSVQTSPTSVPTTLTTSTSTRTTSTSSSTSSTTTSASRSLPSGFSALGCFVDSTSTRTLSHSNGTSTKQTPQQCALNCASQGYKYSGTEYGYECWCGKNIPTNSAPAADCNAKCSGDATQICGASNRLSVVLDNTLKQTFFATSSYKTWNLMSCYIDSTSARLLKTSVSLSAHGGGANATIANCMSACASKGFSYCGEEYYAECYGSNTAPPDSKIAPGADPLTAGCNYPCKGNSSEACGGNARILVYVNNGMTV